MLRHEKAVEKAEAEGRPVPTLEELLPEASQLLAQSKLSLSPSSTASHTVASLPTSTSATESTPATNHPAVALPTKPPTSDSATPSKRYILPEGFTEAAQAALDERLKSVPEAQKEVEAKAFIAEIAATAHTLQRLNVQRKQQEEGIKRRQEKGQETLSDKVITAFRF